MVAPRVYGPSGEPSPEKGPLLPHDAADQGALGLAGVCLVRPPGEPQELVLYPLDGTASPLGDTAESVRVEQGSPADRAKHRRRGVTPSFREHERGFYTAPYGFTRRQLGKTPRPKRREIGEWNNDSYAHPARAGEPMGWIAGPL
jgi:hypothetical protein